MRRARREANARHQRSPEGRADHRDRMRLSRARQRARVTDKGIEKLAFVAPLVPPHDPVVTIPVTPATGGEGNQDEQVHCDAVVECEPDSPAAAGRPGRIDEGCPAAGPPAAAAPGSEHPARGDVAVARHPAARCAVCGRSGGLVLPRPRRRSRRPSEQRVLRCSSGRAARSPPAIADWRIVYFSEMSITGYFGPIISPTFFASASCAPAISWTMAFMQTPSLCGGAGSSWLRSRRRSVRPTVVADNRSA